VVTGQVVTGEGDTEGRYYCVTDYRVMTLCIDTYVINTYVYIHM